MLKTVKKRTKKSGTQYLSPYFFRPGRLLRSRLLIALRREIGKYVLCPSFNK
jgi:hypothetical protein